MLLGPSYLPNRHTGRNYTNLTQTSLPDYMEDMPVASRQQMFFMHDGAPAYFSLSVREDFDAHYPGCWIGRGGLIAWPPRSSGLNPLDFYHWGHLKSLVHSSAVNDEQTVHRCGASGSMWACHAAGPGSIPGRDKFPG